MGYTWEFSGTNPACVQGETEAYHCHPAALFEQPVLHQAGDKCEKTYRHSLNECVKQEVMLDIQFSKN